MVASADTLRLFQVDTNTRTEFAGLNTLDELFAQVALARVETFKTHGLTSVLERMRMGGASRLVLGTSSKTRLNGWNKVIPPGLTLESNYLHGYSESERTNPLFVANHKSRHVVRQMLRCYGGEAVVATSDVLFFDNQVQHKLSRGGSLDMDAIVKEVDRVVEVFREPRMVVWIPAVELSSSSGRHVIGRKITAQVDAIPEALIRAHLVNDLVEFPHRTPSVDLMGFFSGYVNGIWARDFTADLAHGGRDLTPHMWLPDERWSEGMKEVSHREAYAFVREGVPVDDELGGFMELRPHKFG